MVKHIITFAIFFMFCVVRIIGGGNDEVERKNKFTNLVKCYEDMYNAKIFQGNAEKLNMPIDDDLTFDNIYSLFEQSYYGSKPVLNESDLKEEVEKNYENEVVFKAFLDNFYDYFTIPPSNSFKILEGSTINNTNNEYSNKSIVIVDGLDPESPQKRDTDNDNSDKLTVYRTTPKEYCIYFMNKAPAPVEDDEIN